MFLNFTKISICKELTMCYHANITPSLIHTGSFMPSVRHWIVTTNCVKMIAAIKTPNHVDQVIQRTKTMVRTRR